MENIIGEIHLVETDDNYHIKMSGTNRQLLGMLHEAIYKIEERMASNILIEREKQESEGK